MDIRQELNEIFTNEWKQPEPTHDDYMKHGWPTTDWGNAFDDANERLNLSYKMAECEMKNKRDSKEEKLCSLPFAIKQEKAYLNWLKTKGLQICRRTKQKKSDCFKFANSHIKNSTKLISKYTKELTDLKRN